MTKHVLNMPINFEVYSLICSRVMTEEIFESICYVAISVFNQSRPGHRMNSLHVIETDAAYRNPRFRSIPLDNYQGWGSIKRNYLLRDVQIITKENI